MLQTILDNLAAWVPIVVTAAAAAAAAFPQGQEGSWWYTVRKAIDFLAINFGNAKNAPK